MPEGVLRLLVISGNRRVLLHSTAGQLRLLDVEIPRFARLACSGMRAAQERYGLELFAILSVRTDRSRSGLTGSEGLVLVCRMQNALKQVPPGLEWISTEQAIRRLGPDGSAATLAINEFDLYNSGVKASKFGYYSALDNLRTWYGPHLHSAGVYEAGIQQWNAAPDFALFRIKVKPIADRPATSPAAFWFKAVGEPNTREYAVAQALAKECPQWVPKPLATKPDCNGWLMEELEGHELDEETDELPWVRTVEALARIQSHFIGRHDELLALGCRDWRLPRVLAALDPFFENAKEVMGRQPSNMPKPLGSNELLKLRVNCGDMCRRIADLDIPDTIAHGDFSPHNVIVSNGMPKLIDWAESYVTFPFISWEYLWNRLIRDHPEHKRWHQRLLTNYAYSVWAQELGANRVRSALRLSPAFAVLVAALYDFDASKENTCLHIDKVNRSLVRRLQREVDLLQPAGAR